jgi:choline kinase
MLAAFHGHGAAMKAIILSAGLGSRLLPLTADRPKCLVSAGARTILEHQLIALRDAGVEDVTVVGGYKFDRLSEFVARMDRAVPRPRLLLNPFYAVSSSIGSVWAARDLLGGPFCILNGDTLYDPEILSDGIGRLSGGVNLFVEPLTERVHDDMLVRAADGRVLEVGKGLDPAEAGDAATGHQGARRGASVPSRCRRRAGQAAPGRRGRVRARPMAGNRQPRGHRPLARAGGQRRRLSD